MTDRMVESFLKDQSGGFATSKPRARLKQQGKRGRARRSAWQKVIAALKKRGVFTCEACEVHHLPECNGRWEHTHHILPRSQGGLDVESNAMRLSLVHHSWVHRHPELAYKLGLLRKRPAPKIVTNGDPL